MYDYFAGSLRCPRCNHLTDGREHTNMQTHLRSGADGSELRVGFSLDVNDLRASHIIDAGYLALCAPKHLSMSLLNTWQCPSCHTDQWAQVDVQAGVIEAIHAVVMSREVLSRAHFIDEADAELLAAKLLAIPSWELTDRKLDPVEVLRQHLPD